MELVGYQLGITITAIIICLIFFQAFNMKNKSQNIKKSNKKEMLKELPPQPSKIKPRPSQPLSFLDPHQPNYIKRQFNYS